MRICPACHASTDRDVCPQDGTATVPEAEPGDADRLAGRTLGGRYRLEAPIGGGAMGTVYRARHLETGGLVAVKVLHAALGGSAEARRRFLAEARNGAALHHPDAVRVLDAGEDDGLPWLAMELLEGRPLSALLREAGRLPWRRAAAIAARVCGPLQEAHRLRIVHRDVKPSNIVLPDRPDDPDAVKVVDFGVSRALDGSGAGTRGVVGTPAYVAPEQWRGEPIDGRTDLYALGCVLYEMLAGAPPFRAGSFASYAHAHLSVVPGVGPGTLPADVPVDLAVLVRALLAKSPGDRPASADAVRAALDTIRPVPVVGPGPADDVLADETAGTAAPASPAPPAPRRARAALVAVLATAGFVAAAAWALLPRPSPEGGAADVPSRPAPGPVCVLVPADDPERAGAGADAAAGPLQDRLRDLGFAAGCRGVYAGRAIRNAYAAMSGMIQHDGTVPLEDLDRLRRALEATYPDLAIRQAPGDGMRAPIELLLPGDAAARPPAAGATPTACVLAPAADLSMTGPWRDQTPPVRAFLAGQGFEVDCELPYVRTAPRLAGASTTGLVQHDGTRPEALARLLGRLRTRYPGMVATRVEPHRLFRDFDVLLPDRAR